MTEEKKEDVIYVEDPQQSDNEDEPEDHLNSREQAMVNARSKILEVSLKLNHIQTSHVDAAVRVYMLAHQKGFTKGKKLLSIAIICLYHICRKERTGHLLIDFADALSLNPFHLAQRYIKMSRILNNKLPFIDPSFYIQKYAIRLGMDSSVALHALRTVGNMNRKWVSVDKRPTGLCIGALVLAGKEYGIHKSTKEVHEVVEHCNNDLITGEKSKTPATPAPPPIEEPAFNLEPPDGELLDVDDEEVEDMFNDASESDNKVAKWTAENQDYLDKMARRVTIKTKKKIEVQHCESAASATAVVLKKKISKGGVNRDVFSCHPTHLTVYHTRIGFAIATICVGTDWSSSSYSKGRISNRDHELLFKAMITSTEGPPALTRFCRNRQHLHAEGSNAFSESKEDAIDRDLECPVCSEPCVDPVEYSQCDGISCRVCQQSPCPRCTDEKCQPKARVHRKVLAQLNGFTILNSKMSDIHLMKLPDCPRGCGEKVAPNVREAHQTRCNMVLVECTGKDVLCSWMGTRGQREEHEGECAHVKIRSPIEHLLKSIHTLESRAEAAEQKIAQLFIQMEQNRRDGLEERKVEPVRVMEERESREYFYSRPKSSQQMRNTNQYSQINSENKTFNGGSPPSLDQRQEHFQLLFCFNGELQVGQKPNSMDMPIRFLDRRAQSPARKIVVKKVSRPIAVKKVTKDRSLKINGRPGDLECPICSEPCGDPIEYTLCDGLSCRVCQRNPCPRCNEKKCTPKEPVHRKILAQLNGLRIKCRTKSHGQLSRRLPQILLGSNVWNALTKQSEEQMKLRHKMRVSILELRLKTAESAPDSE
ncbi:TATA box-binding protein-associated factor, RNA polymerase III, subunit 2 [Planoprotostelium fungivorum]|uniref:TATA box-binding protein-associated factor, RNA polymerase III, subunit 2 n=1 Tax=Planoprotostelium fungivorum TaxID=1890364 RepID=A0A2P6NML4_9EUKA|nr:TATA box-binding protein-associated factor, RNA polymerase III, subunit 2 [Planoprotostelium fungivorum]